jgi:hypothetical protein
VKRLYWIAADPRHWLAYTPETGYVIFPAEKHGSSRRSPFPGFNWFIIIVIFGVWQINTGFPGPPKNDDRMPPKFDALR